MNVITEIKSKVGKEMAKFIDDPKGLLSYLKPFREANKGAKIVKFPKKEKA